MIRNCSLLLLFQLLLLSHMSVTKSRSSHFSADILQIPQPLSLCACMYMWACSYEIKARERCVSMYFHVPSAHLALVTAPVTCVWLCSIPAPIAPLWESSVMTECCCSSQDPRQYGCSLLCSRPPADQFVVFFHLCLQGDVFLRRTSKARHLCHPQDVSNNTDSCSCLLRTLAFSAITVGPFLWQDSNYWFDLMLRPFD